MSDSPSGGHTIRCSQCEQSFTQTEWRLHAHNPSQLSCSNRHCYSKAVGYASTGGSQETLCGRHLIEALRNGSEVTFVDGRVCRMCEGAGGMQGRWAGPGPGGRWVSCPECSGSGYDPTLEAESGPQGARTSGHEPGEPAPDDPNATHYEVLGLPRDAVEADVRAAFRRLALVYHPDVDNSPGATQRFQRINAAYQVLVDSESKAAYDREIGGRRQTRRAGRQSGRRQDAGRPADATRQRSEEETRREEARRAAERVQEEVRRAAENAQRRAEQEATRREEAEQAADASRESAEEERRRREARRAAERVEEEVRQAAESAQRAADPDAARREETRRAAEGVEEEVRRAAENARREQTRRTEERTQQEETPRSAENGESSQYEEPEKERADYGAAAGPTRNIIAVGLGVGVVSVLLLLTVGWLIARGGGGEPVSPEPTAIPTPLPRPTSVPGIIPPAPEPTTTSTPTPTLAPSPSAVRTATPPLIVLPVPRPSPVATDTPTPIPTPTPTLLPTPTSPPAATATPTPTPTPRATPTPTQTPTPTPIPIPTATPLIYIEGNQVISEYGHALDDYNFRSGAIAVLGTPILWGDRSITLGLFKLDSTIEIGDQLFVGPGDSIVSSDGRVRLVPVVKTSGVEIGEFDPYEETDAGAPAPIVADYWVEEGGLLRAKFILSSAHLESFREVDGFQQLFIVIPGYRFSIPVTKSALACPF